PYLFRDHTQIYPWVGKPGYNLITDMADEAISHVKQLNAAAPDTPFFVYYVPGGSHSPHQPTKEWIDKFKGKFDMGWNAMREQIFANQKRLGVVPANAQLTAWPDSLPKWETLSADEKKLFARQAEVFAGSHQGRRRHPHPVSPHDRHRAHHPRSHGHQGAGDGRRHPAKADRGREHGVHLRQGERHRRLDPQDTIFRVDQQPRDLSRRLV